MTRSKSEILRFLPLPLLFIFMILSYTLEKPTTLYEPPWLLLAANTVFISLISFAVAFIALRNYKITGQVQILLLGCGLLAFGLGGLAAGWLRSTPETGANLTVTMHNSGALIAALFHFAAALTLLTGMPQEETGAERTTFWLIFGYGGLTLLLVLIMAASLYDYMPVFFIQPKGPTLLRQWLLGSSVVLFFFSSLIFAGFYIRYREIFLCWYSLALALITLGLVALFVQMAVGSPVGWVGRFSQYLGGIYFLIAILVVRRSAQKRRIPLGAVLTASLNPVKEAEEALRKNQTTLQSILNATRESVWLFSPDGHILLGNQTALQRFNLAAAQVIGRPFRELLDPELARSRMDCLRKTVESKSPLEFEDERSGIKFHHTFYPVLDPEGNVTGVASFSQDFTERKAAEGRLRHSEARFKLLADTAGLLLTTDNPQALVNTLCEKVMDHLDCQAFFNFLVHEPTGRLHLNACAGIPPEEADKIAWLDYGVAICGCVAASGRPIVAEHIPTTPDIRTDLVRSYGVQAYACHPLLGTGGKLIGTLSFGTRNRETFSEEDLSLMKAVTDQVAAAMERMELMATLYRMNQTLDRQVQERTSELLLANRSLQQEIEQRSQAEEKLKRYTEKLEISNRELQEFAYVASHDLQEPLRKIQTFGSRLETRYGTVLDETAGDYLQRIQKAARRMQALIRSLLDLSRISTKIEPFIPIDLKPVILSVIEDLEVTLETAGGNVEVGDLPVLEADPSQMRQLFQNLIGNALKFRGPEPPLIRISGHALSHRCWQVTVEDNGIGFESEYAELIFAPFQRLNPRLNVSGAGIGLTICRRIVERHSGTIAAEGHPGQGARFTIILPLEHPGKDLP
jgi:PAS domain S-box-containing protein